MTAGAYGSTWLKHSEAHVDCSTYRQRLGHLRDRIDPVIGPIPLTDLKVRHAQEVLDRAADAGKAKGTVERIKSVMIWPSTSLLVFYVDVRVEPFAKKQWIAKADPAGEQEAGVDKDRSEAIEKALRSLGWRYAREMAEGADLGE